MSAFEEWKKTDAYLGLVWASTNGAPGGEFAAAAWNAALDAAIVAINYRDQGSIHLDDAEQQIRALKA